MRGPNEGPARTRRGVRGGGGKARRRLELYANRRGLTVAGPRRGTRAVARAYLQSATALAATDAARTLAGQAPAGQPVPAGPAAVGAGAAWRFLGPAGISNGQTYGSSRVTVSGRIAALAVDPANSAHLLVGSAGGGIWESADSGATWSPRTDVQPTLTTGALLFDPTQPGVAYAGTGEGNFYAWHGAGVMRSTDGGTTWSVLPDSPLVGQGFFDLAIDPTDNTHLLAATTAGVHDSTDGGHTWTSRRTPRSWALSVVQSEALAASADGVWASNDGAQTWTAVALPDAPTSWTRLAVAHAPSNPAVAYVWGATSSAAFLYQRSADGAWQAVTPPPGLRFNQAWYDWYVKVAPDRENQLYLGAIDIFRGDGGDAGWTWLNLSSKSPGDSIHPDQHVLVFDPADPNTVYAGSDGGLFRSPDRGMTWQALNDGLGITEIEYLAQNSGSATWLLAGTQDNGTIRWTGSPKWEHVADGDGGGCGVDGATPTTVFHTFFGMGVARSNASADFGSWSATGPQVPSSYQALFYPPTEVNRSTLAQAGQSTFISRATTAPRLDGGVSLPAFLTASTLFPPNSDRSSWWVRRPVECSASTGPTLPGLTRLR